MGCFSFMCKECGRPILSNSFSGQRVKLFLLKHGKVIQKMEGEYDSYGRVFDKHKETSILWKKDWNTVCDLMFDDDHSNGIAAIHSKCFTGKIPKTRSDDDPNQGWGENDELLDNEDPNYNYEENSDENGRN